MTTNVYEKLGQAALNAVLDLVKNESIQKLAAVDFAFNRGDVLAVTVQLTKHGAVQVVAEMVDRDLNRVKVASAIVSDLNRGQACH